MRLGATLVLVGNQEALQYYERASALFTAAQDWYGIVRCQINAGIVYSLAGDTSAAEAAYQRAVALGRDAHAPDVGGVASLNLGVLYMKAGRYDDAQQYFEEARRLFSQVKNEPHRLATLYNLGLAALARRRVVRRDRAARAADRAGGCRDRSHRRGRTVGLVTRPQRRRAGRAARRRRAHRRPA